MVDYLERALLIDDRPRGALRRADRAQCVLAREPGIVVAEPRRLRDRGHWLSGGTLSGKDGYWQWSFRHLSAKQWAEQVVRLRGGDKQPSRLPAATGDASDPVSRARRNAHINVHRLICWWAHGSPPSDEETLACHVTCGNKLCLNPHHIQWGSIADNAYHRSRHADRRAGWPIPEDAILPHAPQNYVSHHDSVAHIPYRQRLKAKKKGCPFGKFTC